MAAVIERSQEHELDAAEEVQAGPFPIDALQELGIAAADIKKLKDGGQFKIILVISRRACHPVTSALTLHLCGRAGCPSLPLHFLPFPPRRPSVLSLVWPGLHHQSSLSDILLKLNAPVKTKTHAHFKIN